MGLIGKRIKELRIDAKLTQQELATGIMTRSYISQIEHEIVHPSYTMLEKLAGKLNCKVEDFFVVPQNKALLLTQWKTEIKHAESQVESGQVEQAKMTIHNLSIDYCKGLGDYDCGLLMWIKGKISEKANHWEEAENFFKKSIKFFSSKPFISEQIRSEDSLAYVYLQTEQTKKALQVLNLAYEKVLYQQVGGLVKISVLVHLGITHAKLGEYHSAIRFLRYSLELNQATNINYKPGQILMTLGICYRRLLQWSEAQKSYEKALKFFELFEDTENKAGTYTNLGILCAYQKDYQRSIEFLLMSIKLYQEIEDNEKLGNVKVEIARSFLLFKEWGNARRYCFEALEQANSVKNRGASYTLLGELSLHQHHHQEALEYYDKAKTIYKEFGLKEEEKEVLKKIAEAYFAVNDFEKAAKYYRESIWTE